MASGELTAPRLAGYLAQARQEGASDLHLAAGTVPFLRVEGVIRRLPESELEPDHAEEMAHEACALGGVEPGPDVDFCFEHEEHGRYRANMHRTLRGAGLSLKCIPTEIPTLLDLGLPESLHDLTWYRTGMVLVTGPAGCGKTSTLAALVHRINEERREHLITIEDPIEYVHESRSCNVTQRQLGPHTSSFSGALRAALREDPDVILVSELRDQETIRTAVVAAETGHLVLGTLHTRDAAGTVSRLVDVFAAEEQEQVRTMIAASLRCVISQKLLPRAGGGRRVPAYEIMMVTPAVSKLIRDGRTHQLSSQLQLGRRYGMIDLETRLEQMIGQGLIDRDTATANANDPRRFGAPREDERGF